VNALMWLAAGLTAVIVFGAGAEKLRLPIAEYRARRHWAEVAPATQVRTLGVLEVLGAIGLVVPAVTGIAPALVPIAAACIAALMVGAIATEIRDGAPTGRLVLPLVTLGLALLVAVGRGLLAAA